LQSLGRENCGLPLIGEGVYRPPTELPNEQGYGNPSAAYPFAAHAAEVEVDSETGQTRVLRYWAVHDSGRIINPSTARGQVLGAIAQGVGWALMEDVILDKGRVRNPNYLDYRVPGASDMPEVTVEFVEGEDPHGPFGAKSLAEVALDPVTAAVANAIYAATGTRCTALPMSSERLWRALNRADRDD
jgi:CO/xanthine dehydrogenase Mo-binding subunit